MEQTLNRKPFSQQTESSRAEHPPRGLGLVQTPSAKRTGRYLRTSLSYLTILAGTFVVSVAFNMFLSPNHLLVSGIGGVAILISYLLNFSLGVIYLLINIPLFLGGWRYVGFSFFLKSIVGTVSLSLFLVFTAHFPAFHQPVMAALLGGLLSGIAIGCVLLAGGTTGGTDIISVIVNRRSRWSVGRIMFVVNALIVICGAFLFGIEKALLTIVSLFITALAVNGVLKLGGWEKHKSSQVNRSTVKSTKAL